MTQAEGVRVGAVTLLAPLNLDDGQHKVYFGWHHDLGCLVACKKYSSLRSANREGDILAQLAHPAIVRYFGTAEPGWLFTEILDGTILHDGLVQIKNHRMTISDTMRLGIRIGAALDYTHRRGFVHLDVKPGNIIVVGGHPKLFDFGAARAISGEVPSYYVGTDQYMAPELCLKQDAGAPADVFGLGVTLFECLTNQYPFKKRPRGKRFPQLTTPPIRLREERPSAPKALCDLLGAMLSHDPADRPALPHALSVMNRQITSGPKLWLDGA